MRVLSATSSGPFVHDPVPVLAGVKVLAPPGRFTLTRLRPANPAATEASQTPPRSRASPPAPLDKTRPHGCKDSTRQHPVDSGEATHNRPLSQRAPRTASRSPGSAAKQAFRHPRLTQPCWTRTSRGPGSDPGANTAMPGHGHRSPAPPWPSVYRGRRHPRARSASAVCRSASLSAARPGTPGAAIPLQ